MEYREVLVMLRKGSLKVIQWLDWLDRWMVYTWYLFGLAVLLVTFEVLMRYFFNLSHSWFEEVIISMCLCASLLGCGKTTKEGAHIALELFYVQFNERIRRIVDIIGAVIVIVACGAMVVFLVRWGMFQDRMGMTYPSDLKTPLSIIPYILAVGMGLNGLYSLQQLLRRCLGVKG
jgi:TRAP-type C4-dicarboxylate transport system permease small subunit